MGSGFKTFAASEVLTAANLNNYCQTQSVMYFSSTGARDTQITGPVDGMTAYIGSNDSSEGLYTYNGTSWRKGPGWNAPWGYVQYTQTTSNVSVKNGNILVGNTISVVNNRRYRIHGHCNSFISTAGGDVAQVSITVGGTVIQATNITAATSLFAGYGVEVVGYYTATATNSSLACNLYNVAIVGGGTHTFQAGATYPIFIAVEDIGPSGAPV